jgi:hypothetical protein
VLGVLAPPIVSTSVSSSVLYGSLETQCHEYLLFAGYLEAVPGAQAQSTQNKPWIEPAMYP